MVSQLSSQTFERLCCRLLELDGFDNIQWHGESGGDRGRDIVATRDYVPLYGARRQQLWVVQCKRYTSKRTSKDELASFLNSARQHDPDNVLFIISRNLTSDTKDWLRDVCRDYPFQVFEWEQVDLEGLLGKHKAKLIHDFPEVYSSGSKTEFVPLAVDEHYFCCGEFEDVAVKTYNCDDEEEARKRAIEFLQYVRVNDFEVNIDGELK